MPCKLSPGQPAMNQRMRADGWTVLRFDTADVRNHGCSGRRPGTGNRLFSRGFQPSDPAEDAGIECKGIVFVFFGNLISLVIERTRTVDHYLHHAP